MLHKVFPCKNTFLALCASLLVSGSVGRASSAPPPKPEKAPQVEKITEHIYRVGKVIINTAEKTVTCRGSINMDSGPIEYLAVAPGGKTHESLLLVEARPLHLQIGLLLLGLEPKNVLQRQGEKTQPQGAPVEILVRWKDAQGETQEKRAEDLVIAMPGKKTMERSAWVFTGSRIIKEGFEADLEKSLVAVWHDPAAILDNPRPGGAINAYLANPAVAPKRGTPVEFIIKALPPGDDKDAADKKS